MGRLINQLISYCFLKYGFDIHLQCRVCTDAVDALEVLLKAFGPEEKIITDFAEAVSCLSIDMFEDARKREPKII